MWGWGAKSDADRGCHETSPKALGLPTPAVFRLSRYINIIAAKTRSESREAREKPLLGHALPSHLDRGYLSGGHPLLYTQHTVHYTLPGTCTPAF